MHIWTVLFHYILFIDILLQHLKRYFIAVLWLFWLPDINKLFKCKSPLLLFNFLLIDLMQIKKKNTFYLYNFSVCVNTNTTGIWNFGFSFFLLPADTQVYLMDTAVYSSGWVAQYYEAILSTSLWFRLFITWSNIWFLSKETRVHQSMTQSLLSTLEPIISLPFGFDGNRIGGSGQIPVSQMF